MKMKKQTSKSVKDPMLGKFFHSLNAEGKIEWQGVILESPVPGLYLLQLFEWGWGNPNVQRLARIESMEKWLFYPDAESMKFSYEEGVARDLISTPSRPITPPGGKTAS